MSRATDVLDAAVMGVLSLVGALLLARKRRRCPHGDPERSWITDVTWSSALIGLAVPRWQCQGCHATFVGPRYLGFYDGPREQWRQEMAR